MAKFDKREMAVLHKKEEKIQAVLGRLPKKYTQEQFIEMFIKIYSKDWGKIKSAFIKQSQDKEPGSIINMPKPDVYLKQILTNYLQQIDEPKKEVEVEPIETVEVKNPKVSVKKIAVEKPDVTEAKISKKKEIAEKEIELPVKVKKVTKKKAEAVVELLETPKKAKAPAKKKTEAVEEKPKAVKKSAVKK